MKEKVFISARMLPESVDCLRPYAEVDFYDWGAAGQVLPENEFVQRIQAASILVVEQDALTAEILAQAPLLRLIVVCRGTVADVDVPAATRQGILVCNTPGRNADAVADLTVCLMIAMSRHVIAAANAVTGGEWQRLGSRSTYLKYHGIELFGRTAGLVGLGAVGLRVARRLSGFDMRLLAYDPFCSPEQAANLGVQLVSLEKLLAESDYISLHAPVTPATTRMIGQAQIERMKPGAYLINTARSALVDDSALIHALQTKRIAGAAVDVHESEPLPSNSPWYGLDNAILTPHIGGASHDVIAHQSRMAVQSVVDYLEGRTPKCTVNRIE